MTSGKFGLVSIGSSELELLLDALALALALALLTAGAAGPLVAGPGDGLPNGVTGGAEEGPAAAPSGSRSGEICMLVLETPNPAATPWTRPRVPSARIGSAETTDRPPLLTETAPGEPGGFPSNFEGKVIPRRAYRMSSASFRTPFWFSGGRRLAAPPPLVPWLPTDCWLPSDSFRRGGTPTELSPPIC